MHSNTPVTLSRDAPRIRDARAGRVPDGPDDGHTLWPARPPGREGRGPRGLARSLSRAGLDGGAAPAAATRPRHRRRSAPLSRRAPVPWATRRALERGISRCGGAVSARRRHGATAATATAAGGPPRPAEGH